VKYNACVTFCAFPSLSFPFFLPSSTGKTTELILTHDGSYDAVSRKKVPFGGYKIQIQHFYLFFHKNMKNYNGAYGEN